MTESIRSDSFPISIVESDAVKCEHGKLSITPFEHAHLPFGGA